MKKFTLFALSTLIGLVGVFTNASAQIFYGMTNQGGTHNMGTLFKCTASGTITVLVNFDSATNGANPYGSLIQATDGNLYGMTSNGGSSGKGTLFKCTLAGTLTTMVNFTGTNGANPRGSLMQAVGGYLYGMTTMGGTSDSGTLFMYTLSGTLTTLVNFSGREGTLPYGSLMQANDGNLYGMTSEGGDSGVGTIVKYDVMHNTPSVLFNFARVHYGGYPHGTLIQAFDGNLYGLTAAGGSKSGGILFKCTTTGAFTNLYNFDGTGITDAGHPYGRLLQANDSTLFGLSSTGPDFTFGTLFSFVIASSTEAINPMGGCTINAALPYGSLIQASDDSLYGMSTYGGTNCYGIVLKSNLARSFSTLAIFNDTNGAYPYGDLLEANLTEGIPQYAGANTGVSVFPVPANSNVDISITDNAFLPKSLTIYDVTGRKLIDEPVSQLNDKISVNISSLPNGVYFLAIQGEQGFKTGRFVVQH